MTAAEVLKWVSENKTISMVTLWPILSGIINVATRYQSVEEWVKFAESKPRLAHLVKLIRGLGLDPIKVTQALIGFISGRAHDATEKPKLSPTDEKTPEPETKEKDSEEKPS